MPIKNALYHIVQKLKCTPRDIIKFLQLQLFLTLISWPILLYWGLPLSLASPLGNFIFTPFLILFLLLASLIFFSELLYIPNSLLIWLLEQLADYWYTVLTWSSRSWLFYCPRPSFFMLFLIPTLGFLSLHTQKISKPLINTLMLMGILALTALYLHKGFVSTQPISVVGLPEKQLFLITSGGTTVFIDPGYLGKTGAAVNWVNYTLVPELIQKGVQSLDYVVVLKPSSLVFQSLVTLCNKLPIKHIYMVSWQGHLNGRGWQAWEHLLALTQRSTVQLTQLAHEQAIITLSPTESIVLTPTGKNITKNKLCYSEIVITGTIAGKSFESTSSLL